MRVTDQIIVQCLKSVRLNHAMVCAWCVSSRVCVQCQVRRVCDKYRSPGSICATRSCVCSFRSSELARMAAWRVCARVVRPDQSSIMVGGACC